MKVKKMTFLLLFFATVISCQSQKTNNQTNDAQKKYYVQIETSYGNMTVELFNETPKHRDNFIKLVNEGFYDDLLFHRVINNFMIQGGDPNSRNAKPGQMLGNGTLGYTIPAEFVPGLIHRKGALAAARQGDAVNPTKASSSCQFYIVQGNVWPLERLQMMANQMGRTLDQRQIEAYTTVGGTPHLDYDYTVFGQVIEGLDVIDKIAAVKCDRGDRPVEDVKMKIRTAILLSAILLLLLSAAGCGRKERDALPDGGERFLRQVFRGTAYPLPEGWELNPSVAPRWDAETERLTCCALRPV